MTRDKAIEIRRHLHQHPELSLKEAQTSQYCQAHFLELGYQIKPCWQYGFTADLIVDEHYDTIAFRADMDALPIQECNNHDYVSKHDHVAHMCGHDTHMAIALTAAKMLITQKHKLKCNVRFIFQPCEETPPGGALGMIDQGCLNKVSEVYGLHNDPGTQVGDIRLRPGGLMAAADIFDLEIKGRGGHAARPQDCLDPIVAASQLISQWQSLVSRHINPAHCAVLTVGQVHAGDTFNVIPDSAYLQGTVRTFSEADRNKIGQGLNDSLSYFNKQGFTCTLNYTRGYDAVVNHQQGVERIALAAKKIDDIKNIDTQTEPAGWGEDFAYYLQHRKGAFLFLGSGNKEKGITKPLHSSEFNVDEDCLMIGAQLFFQIAMDYSD